MADSPLQQINSQDHSQALEGLSPAPERKLLHNQAYHPLYFPVHLRFLFLAASPYEFGKIPYQGIVYPDKTMISLLGGHTVQNPVHIQKYNSHRQNTLTTRSNLFL